MSLRRLRIDRLAAGGDGVARDDGLVVFIPRTAPGDVVEADVALRRGARFARGALQRVVEPSAARVAPECPHYAHDGCGGCQLQHLTYAAQVHAKAAMVAEAFERLARRAVHAPTVHAAPAPWRYRRKLTVVLRRGPQGVVAGLHAHDDPDRIISLDDCRITDTAVVAAVHAVVACHALLPEGDTLRLAVRLLEDGAALVVEGGRAWPDASPLADAVPALRAIWWRPDRGGRRLVLDRRAEAEPGASFVQVNPAMARVLHDHVVARTLAHAPHRVVDAYAGAGDTAAALAAGGVQVTAIERDAEAAAWASRRLAGAPSGSGVLAAAVEDVIGGVLPADVVILNPPRAGLDARIPPILSGALPPPKALVYVSCDPATLARDVARLPGWRVAHLACFDLFPQTAHVETVCELVPEAS